ncbi:MAG: hypothetical protein H6619_06470 [Deltaproteobacteria bacterium]|nr:hypothetical protein [Deltaproteobacteria bacterium]
MARLSKSGRQIISASEVGAYTVCPESWRLRTVEKVSQNLSSRVIKGQKMHDQWTEKYDESIFVYKLARLVISLLVLVLATFLLLGKFSILK